MLIFHWFIELWLELFNCASGGRCNRENNLEVGILNVFEPESIFTKKMPSSIKRPIEVAKSIMERFEVIKDGIYEVYEINRRYLI
ncbi:MAG: hypothetical protein ACREV6_04615 [Clostridium sp.]|uniref:hypothetical protein n=1 Tax=Clostridium sp. TaxID=1506 RepID=UPI003D6C754E